MAATQLHLFDYSHCRYMHTLSLTELIYVIPPVEVGSSGFVPTERPQNLKVPVDVYAGFSVGWPAASGTLIPSPAGAGGENHTRRTSSKVDNVCGSRSAGRSNADSRQRVSSVVEGTEASPLPYLTAPGPDCLRNIHVGRH